MRSAKSSRVRRYVRQYEDRQARRDRHKIFTPVRILLMLLITAVLAFFGVQVYRAMVQPMQTVTAMATVVNDEISAVGYFVRAEVQISESYRGLLQYTAAEGQKVAKNELFANVFDDPSAAETTDRIDALTNRIETLETALSYSTQDVSEDGRTVDGASTENLSASIRSRIVEINAAADSRSYAQMSDTVTGLERDIINRDFAFGSYEEVQATIAQLNSTRTRLQNSIGRRKSGMYTPKAGYFSAAVDGYESQLTFQKLASMTLEDYEKLDDYTPEILPDVVGKVVTDFSWYFVTKLNRADSDRLAVGQTVWLQFDATGDLLVQARVDDLRWLGSSDALAIFSSDRELSSLISLRKQSARIVVHTYEGIKVPKDALRVDSEYNMGVYVITGMYAEFKKITPVYETEDYYIVQSDPSRTSNLLVFDEIIVSGRNLENRKVIA